MIMFIQLIISLLFNSFYYINNSKNSSMKIIVGLLLISIVYSQYNQTLGKTFGYLTVASYCKPNQIESWSCTPCKRIPNMKFPTVFKNSTNDTLGYIAISDQLDATILVFRGTLPWDLKNWISDINFLKKKYPYCDNNCQVHRGFFEAYQDIQNSVVNAVKNYTATFKKSKLFVTGHSLGAALSTHAVAHLTTLGYKVDTFYNLGSPRVGDANFFSWFNKIFGNRFKARITHHRDPVPHLPFELWGFKHINNQVFYNEDNSFYKVCDNSGEDKTCSNQFDVDASTLDHVTYFSIDYTLDVLECQ